jgi:addiction module HigA family antidote
MAAKIKPIHPGEILHAEFLEPLGLSNYRLAKATGMPADRVGKIVQGRRSITADTALRLARFFGTTPTFWLNLQVRYDLERANDELGLSLQRLIRPHKAA